MSVKVEGLNTLVRAMRAAGKDITDLKEANRQTGAIIASAAAARAPRRSGKLASRIKAAKQQNRVRIMVPASVPYAGPIHYGWPKRNIAAHTFLIDAAEATESEWVEFYQAAVQDVLDTVTAS
jgi:hypothetical protein